VQLVGELSLARDPFRQLWARHDIHVRAGGETAGLLALMESLGVPPATTRALR